MKISGFTFVHNGVEGGYPFAEGITAVRPHVDEVVTVDCQSTDATREVLEWLGARIFHAEWKLEGGETIKRMFGMNSHCDGDFIIAFEADEVWDGKLLIAVREALERGVENVAVHRLQISQNFQRCRWYPKVVHRVFPKGTVFDDHPTTHAPGDALVLPPEAGLLWDVQPPRDDWFKRAENQAKLFGGEPRYRMVAKHMLGKVELTRAEAEERLREEHWTWKTTPFRIPDVLKPLVGRTSYRGKV